MPAEVIGYARVSTADQNTDRQMDNLKSRGCTRIYCEKITGTKATRPELNRMMDALREGDTLVIDSFSRLSRSTKDLLEMVERLSTMGIHLVSLKEQLDTTTATGKLMLTMLSALSQFERDLISERTLDGLKAARARGRVGGRPKVGEVKTIAKAMKLYDANALSNREIAESAGVSLPTLNRWIREHKANEKTVMTEP